MKAILIGLVILNCSWMGLAQNRNPNHRLTVALENGVKKTSIGNMYFQKARSQGLTQALFACHGPQTCKDAFFIDEQALKMNFAFRSSSHDYLSWILLQGLTHFYLQKKTRGLLPQLVEMDQIVFLVSAKYWQQLKPQIVDDTDYADHPRFSFARDLDLSVLKYDRLLKRGRGVFLDEVESRARRFNSGILTVDEFLQGNITSEQKAAAKWIASTLEAL